MKRHLIPSIALSLALVGSANAYALEVPTGTTVQNLNGVQQYIKTYTVAPDLDPQELIEEPFDYEGYTYSYAEMTKVENRYVHDKFCVETVTVETEKKDLEVVLDALAPIMEYDDGQYSGTLSLDHTTIKTEAAGYETKSYTVTATKEINNLDSNDMAYVPNTTIKDGVTVQLQNVDWQVQGTALVDDILVPSSYKAVATYTGRTSYKAATRYITTAEYTGTVSCDEVQSVTYTVIYIGSETNRGGMLASIGNHIADHKVVYGCSLAGLVALAAGGTLFVKRRKSQVEDTDTDSETEETEDIAHED